MGMSFFISSISYVNVCLQGLLHFIVYINSHAINKSRDQRPVSLKGLKLSMTLIILPTFFRDSMLEPWLDPRGSRPVIWVIVRIDYRNISKVFIRGSHQYMYAYSKSKVEKKYQEIFTEFISLSEYYSDNNSKIFFTSKHIDFITRYQSVFKYRTVNLDTHVPSVMSEANI